MTQMKGVAGQRIALCIVVPAALIGAGFFAGYLPRKHTSVELRQEAERRNTAPPIVATALVTRAPVSVDASFPGTVTPITEAYVYARASGYLKRRFVDIGDRVREGQLLAEIDAPDLDQQVIQAKAAVAQADSQLGQAVATLQQLTATSDLARVTWQRYHVLTRTGAVSRQAGDAQETAARTAEANVAAGEKSVAAAREAVSAAQAELSRLQTLQRFEQVTAPFSGVVTARNVDIGALIAAGGGSQGPTLRMPLSPSDSPGGGEMFRVAQIARLRVLVSLPQTEESGIRVGQLARVSVEQYPGKSFEGRITRTSSALDPASRTLLTEIQVANSQGLLLPGMYATVSFVSRRPTPPLLIPDAALVVTANGTSVAILQPVTPDSRESDPTRKDASQTRVVHYRPVRPGRDYGTTLEILDGLEEGMTVVVTPNDAVKEGALVRTDSIAPKPPSLSSR